MQPKMLRLAVIAGACTLAVAFAAPHLIQSWHIPPKSLGLVLTASNFGVLIGSQIFGWVGDRIGRKLVIWCSILGILPFTLALPYANLFWTGILTVVIGLILVAATWVP